MRLTDLPYWALSWLHTLLYSTTAEARDQRRAYEAFVADGGDPDGIYEVEEWLGLGRKP